MRHRGVRVLAVECTDRFELLIEGREHCAATHALGLLRKRSARHSTRGQPQALHQRLMSMDDVLVFVFIKIMHELALLHDRVQQIADFVAMKHARAMLFIREDPC